MSKLVGIGVGILLLFGCAYTIQFSQWTNCASNTFGFSDACESIFSSMIFTSTGASFGILVLVIGIFRSFLKKKPMEVIQGPQVQGDLVGGDKVGGDRISTGNISESVGIAIGKNIQSTLNSSPEELRRQFDFLNQVAKAAPVEIRNDTVNILNLLEIEISKRDYANDTEMARLIEELVRIMPDITGVLVVVFSSSAMKKSFGPVTNYVLSKLDSR